MNGQPDGRTDGRTDGQMDGQTEKHFPPFLIQKRRESMTDQGYRWPLRWAGYPLFAAGLNF